MSGNVVGVDPTDKSGAKQSKFNHGVHRLRRRMPLASSHGEECGVPRLGFGGNPLPKPFRLTYDAPCSILVLGQKALRGEMFIPLPLQKQAERDGCGLHCLSIANAETRFLMSHTE